jgi:hypothetical protein
MTLCYNASIIVHFITIMLNVVMLTVAFYYYYAKCHYTESL